MTTRNKQGNDLQSKGRGVASMDAAKQKEIASKGGKASALGNTAKRGFASMDIEKQREISKKGGKASHNSRVRNSPASPEQSVKKD